MVELEFHCCFCGEENKQCHFVEKKYLQEEITTICDNCDEQVFLTVLNETKVINVEYE